MRLFDWQVLGEAFLRPGGPAFIVLFALEAFARATLSALIPLQAYHLLGNAQKVSVLYFSVSVVALAASLFVPWIVRRLRRRWTLLLGASCLVISPVLFSIYNLQTFVPALILQMFGAASIMICLNLYVLERIPRNDLMRFEPVRALCMGAGWMIGPALGVFLQSRGAIWLPYVVSGAFALLMIAYFLFLRVPRAVGEVPGVGAQVNPLRFVRRFFSQPRLRLAWVLAVGRASWWGMFYVYAPIYAASSGLGEEAGGLIVSAGASAMYTVMLWGWLGRKIGLRRLLTIGFATAGVLTLTVGVVAGWPLQAAGILIIGAIGISIADGAGNVPFLRAVRAHDRSEMTTVFSTYRDSARLAMPALYSLLLLVFPLSAVFFASGGIMCGLAVLAGYLPRNLGRERRRR